MTNYQFDEEKLRKELSELSEWHTVAFAAACCERLLPNYMAFSQREQWGDSDLLRIALDEIWASLNARSINIPYLNELIAKCEKIIPDPDDFNSRLTSPALDASSAIAETLEALIDKKAEKVANVATLARDTIDLHLQISVNNKFSILEYEEKLLSHPLMVTELKKPYDDLELLKKTPDIDSTFLRFFKENAKINGKSNIGL